MPEKYVIHTKHVPHRFEPITQSGIIAWKEGCLRCAVCVKKNCIYGVYENRGLDSRQMIDSLDNQCMNCLRCVQSCPKELIHKSINPEFKAIGDTHWTPNIIARLWYQAETGKIPVSGAGYPGPFTGQGFDSMWTDMSEIVRPTRDGIHGREYISTAVDLGKRPIHLGFDESGKLVDGPSHMADIPLPIILRFPDFGATSKKTVVGWCLAAKRLGTFIALPERLLNSSLDDFTPWIMPILSLKKGEIIALPKAVRIVEIPWREDWQEMVEDLVHTDPSLLVCVNVPMDKDMEQRTIELVEGGISMVHIQGTLWATMNDDDTKTLKESIRSLHTRLIEINMRDEVTLLVSGGLAMAEYVAKSLICGADAVFIDFPILIAIECRMCRRCTKNLPCPVEIQEAPSTWVAARTINLMGAWHNQLLEVMGAMGIRDARRLRGEVGRAMFFEEIDKSVFGSLGQLKKGYEFE